MTDCNWVKAHFDHLTSRVAEAEKDFVNYTNDHYMKTHKRTLENHNNRTFKKLLYWEDKVKEWIEINPEVGI